MKFKVLLQSLALSAVSLAGCSKNPADDVPAARVKLPEQAAPLAAGATNLVIPQAGTPAAAAEAASEAAATTQETYYAMTPERSSIGFVGSKVTGKHDGGFKSFKGEFKVTGGKVADAGNRILIDTTSIWTDTDQLTEHLKTPDFFDTAQFPTAEFVTTSVQATGTNTMITGNLTLHGVTKGITFPASVGFSADWFKATAEFSINRFDFDIKYPGKADDLIREEVVIKFNVDARPGRADFSGASAAAP